jgi:hypothetical protein
MEAIVEPALRRGKPSTGADMIARFPQQQQRFAPVSPANGMRSLAPQPTVASPSSLNARIHFFRPR